MKVELLAPAGSYECLMAALNAGADAVYIGGSRFGARAYADNPDEEELGRAIDECHVRGKKIYLTVNTLLKDRELSQLYEYLAPSYERGIDAVIVQDMGVFAYLRRQFPDLMLHASTQMTVTGSLGAKMLKELGASRIVTPRELSLEEISTIHEETEIEIESFVHGALCYGYSGQCLYSSLIGGRSGNRGRCAQPCRLPYDLYQNGEKKSKGDQKYLLSPKDMCTLDLIPEMIEAGIHSFKIEGRMKKPAYTAGVVRIYRKYIDLYLQKNKKVYSVDENDRRELMDLYSRGGFSAGYYRERNGKDMISLNRSNHAGTKAAKVKGLQNTTLKLQSLEELNPGDVLEIGAGSGNQKNPEVTLKERVKNGENFTIRLPGGCKPNDGQTILRTRNGQLIQELEDAYLNKKFQEKINGNLILSMNQPAILELTKDNYRMKSQGALVSKAMNQPLTIDKVRKQMQKTGNSPFIFQELNIVMDPDIFLPVQALNELRREALDLLTEEILSSYRRTLPLEQSRSQQKILSKGSGSQIPIRISLEDLESFQELLWIEEVSGIYLDCCAFSRYEDFLKSGTYIEQCRKAGKKCFYIMPHIFREETKEYYRQEEAKRILSSYDGILIRNLEELQFLKELEGIQQIALDHNLYTFNKESCDFFAELGIAYDTAPLELNDRELGARGCENSELMVYGYLPMMVSAQCLKKTTEKCTSKPELMWMKDRMNKEFPVKTHCQFCYNTIYNCTPLVLIENAGDVRKLNPSGIRLSFTIESKKDIIETTNKYIEAFCRQKTVRLNLSDFTRGHFKRGVE